MKVRVKKSGDDVHVHSFPWHLRTKYPDTYGQMTDEQFMDAMTKDHPLHGSKWVDADYYDCEHTALPSRDTRCQWICENKTINIDTDWSKKLMPSWLIRKKQIDYHATKIKEELDKPTPDAVEMFRNQLSKDDLVKMDHVKHEKEIYEMALSNLSRADQGKDVSVVRAKLEAKIAELTNE